MSKHEDREIERNRQIDTKEEGVFTKVVCPHGDTLLIQKEQQEWRSKTSRHWLLAG